MGLLEKIWMESAAYFVEFARHADGTYRTVIASIAQMSKGSRFFSRMPMRRFGIWWNDHLYEQRR